jgi:hypothetical protein
LLGGGLATAMMAVTAIAAVRPHHGRPVDMTVGSHAVLAATTLALGAVAPFVHAAALLLGLVAIAVAQLVVSLRRRPSTHAALHAV